MKYSKLLIVIMFFTFLNTVNAETFEVKLSKCVDGDTARFIYDDEEFSARFLAIDTPESVHPTKEVELYGKDASEYTCKMLTNAEKIELEYDPDSDEKDKYGRSLVWVFVDGELLQENLISVGYAQVKYLYGDYMYTDLLYTAENKAKENKLGIWNEEESTSSNTKEENKKATAKDTKDSNKETLTFDIGGVEINISRDNTAGIILIVVLAIILVLTKSKIRVKKKK